MEDHPFIGPTFTWTNNQGSTFQARKLDRILVNDEWNVLFPGSVVEFKPPGVSDHCLCLLQRFDVDRQPKKHFKFFLVSAS